MAAKPDMVNFLSFIKIVIESSNSSFPITSIVFPKAISFLSKYLRNADESIYFRIDQETLIMTPYNKRQFKVFSNPKVVIFENINKKLPKENWELYEKFL